jgi:DNA replication and repair protein RecF
MTLAGPHRDDLEFVLNGMPLKRFGSQGQQRSFVLALKMAEISYLEDKFGDPPILLLDDMTSELDRKRNRNFMEFLEQRQMQVFITTTSLQNIMLHEAEQLCTFRIEAGQVLSENRGNDDRPKQ